MSTKNCKKKEVVTMLFKLNYENKNNRDSIKIDKLCTHVCHLSTVQNKWHSKKEYLMTLKHVVSTLTDS